METEQQFSLSWNNFHGNVSRELSALLGSGALADVTLAAGGQLLRAHRLVLSICSPYFKRMFQSNPGHHPIVVLRDVTHDAMRDLLQFMYHGEVSVRREELTGFIATAELLQIKGLTNKETDEEEHEQEPPKQRPPEANITPDPPQTLPETTEPTPHNDDFAQTVQMKRKLLNDRIQRLNQLKRKSEDFLQSNFSYRTEPHEKIPKFPEKASFRNHSLRHDGKGYNESFTDTTGYAPQTLQINEEFDSTRTVSPELGVKAECDDSDIIVTDPAVRDSMKSFDSIPDQSSQDDASGLGAIFTDLRSVVNGRFRSPLRRTADHRLTTIPQKEDGKKKYPQRSCRTCWRVGKRRDTRFMCSHCAIPFCRSPCYELHLGMVMTKTNLSDGAVAGSGGSLPSRYRYIYSRKGHKQLVHADFVYTKHSCCHGKTSWRCVQYFSLSRCPATVETVDHLLLAVNHRHNHDDYREKLAHNAIYESVDGNQ